MLVSLLVVGPPLASHQQWQWWQLCGAAVALLAVAVPMSCVVAVELKVVGCRA